MHCTTRRRFALKKTALEYLDYAENEIQTMTDLKVASRVIQLHSHQNGPDVFYTVPHCAQSYISAATLKHKV
jgi:hypothetical protein